MKRTGAGYTLIRTLRRKNLFRVDRGYTLIEILVALTIVGLLFGFGFVSFRDFSRRQIVIGTADKIRGDLRLAQGDASSGQKPQDSNCDSSMILDSIGFNVINDKQYAIEAHCTSPVLVPVTVEIKKVDISADISITAPSPNPINFKVLGQGTNIPSNGSAVINITQTGTTNVATVTVTGGGEIQ